jgi:hypothetical protein
MKVRCAGLNVFLIFIKKEKTMRIAKLELFMRNNFLLIIMN